MKKLYLVVFIVSLIFISSCSRNIFDGVDKECKGSICIIDKLSCNKDLDCSCGRDTETNDCAYGNKKYINKSEQCPDFCNGITNNLEVKCIDNKCKQVQKQISIEECSSNNDCTTGGCSGQLCGKRGEVENLVTTCEYLPIYDCYRKTSCGCVNGKCSWLETPEYISCVTEIEK